MKELDIPAAQNSHNTKTFNQSNLMSLRRMFIEKDKGKREGNKI